jgi:hypothetical protein
LGLWNAHYPVNVGQSWIFDFLLEISEMLSEPGFKGYSGLSYVPFPAWGAGQLVDSAVVIFLFGVVT